MRQGQAGRTEPDQVGGADFLQLDPTTAPRHGVAGWLTGAVRAGITDGRLPAGTRLPATRLLAGQLGVSRGTVVEAYQRLTDEGLLSGRRGGGTTVLAAAPVPPPTRDEPAPDRAPIDLRPGLPDLSAFPRQAWLRAERAALARTPDAELGYGDPRGTVALRTALATWLARSRGVRADPSAIVVVNGVAQGLALLAQVLARRGVTTVGVRGPGLAGHARPAGTVGTRAPRRPGGRPRAATSTPSPGPGVGPSSRPPRTSTRPASCSPRRAAAHSWTGPGTAASSSRTTTTPSTATTARRWPRSRRSPPSTSVYAGQRVEDCWPRPCGWAGWSPRRTCGRSWWCASSGRTSPAPPSASSPWPSSWDRAPSSGTCAGSAAASAPGATRCSPPCASTCPMRRVHGVAAGLHLLVGLDRTVSTTRTSPSAPWRPASRCSRCRTTACAPARPVW